MRLVPTYAVPTYAAVEIELRDEGVWAAVADLSPKRRAAIALFYLEDCSVAEISEILRCSVSTARAAPTSRQGWPGRATGSRGGTMTNDGRTRRAFDDLRSQVGNVEPPEIGSRMQPVRAPSRGLLPALGAAALTVLVIGLVVVLRGGPDPDIPIAATTDGTGVDTTLSQPEASRRDRGRVYAARFGLRSRRDSSV